MAEMGPWIAPLSASQTIFLDKLPPEILTLIAKEVDYWTRQLSSLYKVNKTCNAACTSALYSGSLEFVDSKRSLNLFADTILRHRPDLATLVKDLEIYGLLDLPGRGSSFLAALTNLRRLRIFASEYERWTPYCTFFHPIPILPALRHLELCFSLNADVPDFVQSHYLRLSSLPIYTVDGFDGYDIQPATGMVAELCARYSLPLPVSRITCSPFLAPIFVPGSCVSTVSLWWDSWDDVDDAAETAVPALAQSADPVCAVSFWSYSWNLKFIELYCRSTTTPDVEDEPRKDEELSSRDFEDDPEAFFEELLYTLEDTLPSFNSLKVLCLTGTYEDRSRTLDDDFEMAREWASHCPTLLQCIIPQTGTVWIRHPSYQFFVPDMKARTSLNWIDSTHHQWINTIGQWSQELVAKEGSELATLFFQQYEDIEKDGIADVVYALWDRIREY